MTTVGYGDRRPVTTTGRCVAAALMLAGIALLGVATATLASWLVERVTEANEPERATTQAQVETLTREVRALREALGMTGPTPAETDPAGSQGSG
jgi:voltage-gated potassium channel